MFNGLRLASGILLLPLLLHFLSGQDLGMHYNFLAWTGFLLSFDAMFGVTVTRAIGYALRGVERIPSIGIATVEDDNRPPNTKLLGQVLGATKHLYSYLAIAIVVLLGVVGSSMLSPFFPKTSNPAVARIAWGIMVFSACLELYTGYWLVFLRGMNQVVLSARLATIIYGTKLLLTCSLLAAHLGLMAVPIASLFTGVLQRLLARHFVARTLPAGTVMDSTNMREVLASLWPNSWRLGLILLSANVMAAAFTALISKNNGLATTGRYGVSQQIVFGVCVGMAAVWTMVKWPMVVQLRATNDLKALQRLLWPRIWLQLLTFAVLAAGFVLMGQPVLNVIAPSKQLLPSHWLAVMAIYALFDMNYNFWTTLISTENRIPSLWAAVATNLASVGLAAALMHNSTLGFGSVIIAPLLCGLLFNYWFWPRIGAQGIGATWFRYMFTKPDTEPPGITQKVAATETA